MVVTLLHIILSFTHNASLSWLAFAHAQAYRKENKKILRPLPFFPVFKTAGYWHVCFDIIVRWYVVMIHSVTHIVFPCFRERHKRLTLDTKYRLYVAGNMKAVCLKRRNFIFFWWVKWDIIVWLTSQTRSLHVCMWTWIQSFSMISMSRMHKKNASRDNASKPSDACNATPESKQCQRHECFLTLPHPVHVAIGLRSIHDFCFLSRFLW